MADVAPRTVGELRQLLDTLPADDVIVVRQVFSTEVLPILHVGEESAVARRVVITFDLPPD